MRQFYSLVTPFCLSMQNVQELCPGLILCDIGPPIQSRRFPVLNLLESMRMLKSQSTLFQYVVNSSLDRRVERIKRPERPGRPVWTNDYDSTLQSGSAPPPCHQRAKQLRLTTMLPERVE